MSVTWKILFGFGILLFVVIATIAVSHVTISRMLDARDLTLHTHQVIEKADSIWIDLLNIETGARGYAISGRKTFLQPLTIGISTLQTDCDSLKELTSDNPKKQDTITELQTDIRNWLETEIDPLVHLRGQVNSGTAPPQRVIDFIDSERGKVQMDAIRAALGNIQQEENSLLQKRDAEMIQLTRTSLILLKVAGWAVILIGIIAAFLTASSIRKPIEKAVTYAKRVTRGDYSATLDLDQRDEIGVLGNALRVMVGELTSHIALLKNREKELENSNRELSIKKREVEEFTTVAAHDLQEPLRKIQAFGDRIKKDSINLSQSNLDFLNRMINAANRMQALVKAVLDYSRVMNRQTLFEPVDLNIVMSHISEDLSEQLEEKRGKIDAEDLPVINAVPAQMHQLFQNLLSNALKYSKPDTSPEISVHGRRFENNGKEMCEISFCDNGIGFDEKFLPKIFIPFQRLHGAKEYEGTGIGLSICRRIMEQHNGTIAAHSIPGQGSTFVITLPCSAIAPQTTTSTRLSEKNAHKGLNYG